jgi:hypothetical protein
MRAGSDEAFITGCRRDAWEREGEDPRYFFEFGPKGYALGINVILYALSH